MKFLALKSLFFFALTCFATQTNRQLSGGSGTSGDLSRQAFSHSMSNATRSERRNFGVGNSFFKQAWVEFPSSTIGRDGLGPLFNAVSCSSCHKNDGRGPGLKGGKVHFSLLFRLKGADLGPHPIYGEQIQPLATNAVTGEGKVTVQFKETKSFYPDGTPYTLISPLYRYDKLNFGTLGEDTLVSPRVASQLIGLGLLEAIDEKDLENFNPQDVSGELNWVKNIRTGKREVGRFGWKAEQPNLEQQNAAAFIGDMGLSSRLFTKQNCTEKQYSCLNAPKDPELEVSDRVLDRGLKLQVQGL